MAHVIAALILIVIICVLCFFCWLNENIKQGNEWATSVALVIILGAIYFAIVTSVKELFFL